LERPSLLQTSEIDGAIEESVMHVLHRAGAPLAISIFKNMFSVEVGPCAESVFEK
jgi:hypothetical protein